MNRHGSMNRIYRLVWSAVRSVWIPVAETARGRGKRSSPALVAAALSLTCAIAQATPTGGQVTAGTGSITQSGSTTTITQGTQNLSLTWASFNIAPQQSVNFVQPSTSAIAVNRILGTNGTQILGYLHANGQVFLINPNGIVFGPSAEVNVGGLVASTLALDEAGITGNTKAFSGSGTGSVLNQGTLTATPGGYVVLLGNHVSNEGVISAQLGTVALGAGSAVTLTFGDNSRLHLQVDESVLNSLASNGGLIRADGGHVIMTAGARDTLLASAVNNTGVIEARTVDTHDGTITLLGGMTAGTVHLTGTLDASAPDGGNGGQIDTSAAHVEVAGNARVTTAARDGLFGSWLIDPEDYTVAASGGDTTGALLSSALGGTNVTLQSSAGTKNSGGSGDVNVNDAITWSANTTLTLTASNNVNVNANITASGATAGLIINPNTTNGSEQLTHLGTFNLTGASITLTGATPFLSIGGTAYTVINTLGAPGSMTGTDLQGINGNLAGHYALGSNIDASATATLAWNSGAGFTPIGTSSAPFTGAFNGLGHTITNLTISLPTTNNVGLFGYIGPTAIVKNVGLVGGSVSGAQYVGELVGHSYGSVLNSYATGSVNGASNDIGGLIGYNYGAVINSYATGSVIGSGNNVGGLAGYNSGTVLNDYATGDVSSFGNNTGGLVGFNSNGGINTSYATGAVNGVQNVGGLVGNSAGIDSTITNSYAAGSVMGSESPAGGLVGYSIQSVVSDSYATGSVNSYVYAGGLIGEAIGCTLSNSYATGTVTGVNYPGGLVGFSNGTITSSYSTGTVTGVNYPGGLVGANDGTITSGYWNTTANPIVLGVGIGPLSGAVGLMTPQMQNILSFNGFTFTATPGLAGNYWVMVDTDGTLNNANGVLGATFPMLSSEYSTVISNAHQLQLIVMALGASYTLAANINAAGTNTSTTLSDVWSSPSGFIPIGSQATPFIGATFNGLGHTISGLTINLPTTDHVGLFGLTASNSVIENVGLLGGSVTGHNNVGALVGYNVGVVNNSYATGSVTGSSYVGGLVGFNDTTVTNSHASGAVSGINNVGGLVGFNDYAVVSNSYATGNISGTASVGGLVGYGNVGSVSTSYATGNVTGSSNVGGLVGYNYDGAITASHATGTVTGTTGSSSVGGLVGNNYGSATITSSYASGGLVAGYTNVGGLAGTNTGTITGSDASGHVSSTNVTAGGLVGNNPGGTISNSYATGTVTGSSYVGGLVGFGSGPISNSHATGDVTSGGSSIGGLFGIYQSGTITNSYATGSVSAGGLDVGGLVGNNAGGAISDSHAAGNVTGMSSTVGGLAGYNSNGLISNSFASGIVQGAADSGGLVGKNYGTVDTSYASGSTTGTNNVGGLVAYNRGTVSNSHADNTVNGNIVVGGLVGYNYGGTISSSSATGSVTSANGRAGGLAGNNYGANSSISNSYATGPVSGAGLGVGGLVGSNGDTIINSHATGTVADSGDAVGGLVGHNYGPVTNSYATGNVRGTGMGVGGLTGTNGNGGSISNSYATGTVSSASSNAGGLVGYNYGGIANTYATGTVTSTSSNAGGLVGLNSNGGAVNNSYATGSVSGAADVGGLVGNNQTTITSSFWNADVNATGIGAGTTTGAVGLTTAGMMTMSNFSSALWNISATGGSGDVWRIYEGNTAPLLLYFLTPLTVTAQDATHTYTGIPVTDLIDASYSVSGAATSGHLFNLGNPYNGTVNVGTYAADLYSDQQGYDISYVNATLTLTPATLTVTANTAGKAYGQANPVLSGTITGFVSGDTLASATTGYETYATAATATSNVGTYAITAAGLTADNGNYLFSFAASNATAFSITPATLTVTGEVAASRIYNGTTDTTLSGGTLAGMVSGDTVTLTQAGHFTTPDAGTGVPVAATDTLVGAGAGNYVLAEPTDIVANITPATLTYTAASASFTAGQTPTGLSGTLAGFVAGDTALNATTGSLTWITTAGAESAPGHYAIDGSGLTAINYVFVDAAANATALTLLTPPIPPPSGPTAASTAALLKAQNAVTSIEVNLPSSQTNIQLAMLDVPTNIAVTQSLEVDTDVAPEPAASSVLDKRSAHRAMVPSLRVVRGGVKLPVDQVDTNAR